MKNEGKHFIHALLVDDTTHTSINTKLKNNEFMQNLIIPRISRSLLVEESS
jgi:hypothetical protein